MTSRDQSRLLSRRRVLMIMSFFAALCFAFADSTSSLLFSDDSVRIKRDVGSPIPSVDHDSTSKAQCPYESRKLVGENHVNVSFVPDWTTVNTLVGSHVDGCYSPADCNPRQKVAIIIPYKNREEHLKSLLATLHPMLQRQETSYCVFVSEQEDDGRFNKGAVMNAGFREVMKSGNFDCVIFHDVDMLPENDRNIYQCQDSPVHLSPLIDKFDYKPYGTDFGGVTMLRPAHYVKVNGMSNLFWGWGREDDDMQFRVQRANFTVAKPVNYDSARYKMIPHQHPWIFRNFKLRDATTDVRYLPPEYLVKYRQRSTIEGVNSVDYKLVQKESYPGYTHFRIELRRLHVAALSTQFYEINRQKVEILNMNPQSCTYERLDNTVICEEYGHTMVLKSLRKKALSYSDAVKLCDELGYMCVGFVSDGAGKYRVREVTQLLSSDNKSPQCNTGGDHVYHKSCPGDVSFVQVARNIINGKISPNAPQMPFEHQITLDPIVPSRGDVIFRQALLYEGKQIGPVFSQSLGKISSRRTVEVDFAIPMPLPGYYTLVSKLTDELGQPLYEWKWSTRYSTDNPDTDARLRLATSTDEAFRRLGWSIQTYDEFIATFNRLYEPQSERTL